MSARDELAGILAGVVNGPEDGTRITRRMAEAAFAAGYRRPRMITTAEELGDLPNGLVLRAGRLAYEHHEGMFNGVDGSHVDAEYISLPATVLYTPKES